jgi:anti-sigma B factor antagonist
MTISAMVIAQPVLLCQCRRMTSAGPAPCSARSAAAPLALTTDADGGCIRVVARGELSHTTADELRRVVATAAAAPTVDTVALDLTAVTFIDSSGVSALLASRLACSEAGAELRVRKGAAVGRMLDRTALAPLFPE